MPEVQEHGFIWQNDMSTNVYGANEEELKEIGYTAKMDLPAELNKKDNCDLSFKVSNSENTVCMGDCIRLYDALKCGKPLHMNVLNYEQVGDVKRMKSVVEIDITGADKECFGSVTRDELLELDKLVKSVPQKRKPTPEEHIAMYNLQKSLKIKTGAIYLNIKCNSTQSRLQCSFNKFKKFMDNYPERIIARNKDNEFRGGKVLSEIVSGLRKFK
jgi:hypothetical protein